MSAWTTCPAVERVADRVSRAWVFKGTGIPVRALFENLEAGARVEESVAWFPGVTHEQVMAVLAHAERSLASALSNRKLAILVLPTTARPRIQERATDVAAALTSMQPGEYRELRW